MRRNIFRNADGVFDIQSVLVGVVITGILMSASLVSIFGFVRMSQLDQTKADLKLISQALETYYSKYDSYPRYLQGLKTEGLLPEHINITQYGATANPAIPTSPTTEDTLFYAACHTPQDTSFRYAQGYILGVRVSEDNSNGFYTWEEPLPKTYDKAATWVAIKSADVCALDKTPASPSDW